MAVAPSRIASAAPLRVTVASPCSLRWSDLEGNERARFCGTCQKHVYNLSALTREEALETVKSVSVECVAYLKNPDGSVRTRDDVGLVDRVKGAFAQAPEPGVHHLPEDAPTTTGTGGDELDDGYMMGDVCEEFPEDD
jgi:hypothetical protein